MNIYTKRINCIQLTKKKSPALLNWSGIDCNWFIWNQRLRTELVKYNWVFQATDFSNVKSLLFLILFQLQGIAILMVVPPVTSQTILTFDSFWVWSEGEGRTRWQHKGINWGLEHLGGNPQCFSWQWECLCAIQTNTKTRGTVM